MWNLLVFRPTGCKKPAAALDGWVPIRAYSTSGLEPTTKFAKPDLLIEVPKSDLSPDERERRTFQQRSDGWALPAFASTFLNLETKGPPHWDSVFRHGVLG